MSKTLELHFLTEEGRTARLSIDSPLEPVNIENVKDVMSQVINNNIFMTDYGDFAKMKHARVVERIVTDYDLN